MVDSKWKGQNALNDYGDLIVVGDLVDIEQVFPTGHAKLRNFF